MPPGTAIRFTQTGGEVETADKIIKARGGDLLQKGEFVVFLRWNDHYKEWQLGWGPSAVYALTALGIKSGGDSPGRATVEAMDRQTLLARLRALSK